MADPAPIIMIERDGGGFAVSVRPEQATDWFRTFGDHRDAFGWASGIRLATGWRIHDASREIRP